MSRVLTIACAATLAGCSFTPRDGQFLCSPSDERCPDGFSCVAGRCVAGGTDASSLDAATGPDTGDAPGLDAFVEMPDASGPDAFGADAFVEIPDAFSPDASVPESCTPGAGRRPVDENGDGFVDEHCPYTLSQPHVVLAAMPVAGEYFGVDLTSDGLAMFSSSTNAGAPVFVARRDSVRLPWVAQPPLTSTVLAGRSTDLLTVRGDGLELILQSTDAAGVSRLYASTASAGVFATPSEITELIGATSEEVHPYLRRDGLELYFVRRPTSVATPSEIHVSRRATTSSAWDPPHAIGAGTLPTLSPDGGTLFYSDDANVLRYVERGSLTDDFVIAGATAPALTHPTSGRTLARFVYFAGGREAYFLHRNGAMPGTVPNDAPRADSIFRVQVCRSGACTVDLGAPCGAILSDDMLHCYRQLSAVVDYDTATRSCSAEEHLVSIHSPAEADLVGGTWLNSWMGLMGTAWQSGEPYLYDEFTIAEPIATQCATTTWGVTPCGTPPRSPICERDHWPRYVD